MRKILLYFHTLRYLKFKQLWFQCFYLLSRKLKPIKLKSYPLNNKVPHRLNFRSFLSTKPTYHEGTFTFLNKSKHFGEIIDWQFSEYGKLWRYNLNYFDYLNQEGMKADEGLSLINQFIDTIQNNKVGLEPYPTSLRIINWIKFLTHHKIQNETIMFQRDTKGNENNPPFPPLAKGGEGGFERVFSGGKIGRSLYAQASLLSNNIEYHLLGNHLIENVFALFFASYYFEDFAFYKKAQKILINELQEQILPDGAHFELSPMYHQIILNRILDCVNLTQNNNLFGGELSNLLAEKAAIMLGWLRNITFKNGDIPLVNDATNGIAPINADLFAYASRLGIQEENFPMKGCDYRKIEKNNYEIVVDVGNIGPDYIPRHAHSDTFNFILYIDEKPFIIDTGVSRYEANSIRQYERSTKAHNTVQIEDYEQSEIWKSFRVGRRSFITECEEKQDFIRATHDGYKKIGAFHTRIFEFQDKKVYITDKIDSKKSYTCYAYFHFHPDISVTIDSKVVFMDSKKIIFKNHEALSLEEYYYSPEFNKRLKSSQKYLKFKI